MSDDLVSKMLKKEYEIKLKGAEIGYILTLVANQQLILDGKLENDITDEAIAMESHANNVVGNVLFFEAYRTAGAKLIALALNMDEETMNAMMAKTKRGKAESLNMEEIGIFDKTRLN